MSKNTNLTPYIDAISARFRPALSPETATHRFSTSEVKTAIKSLNPGIEVTEEQIFEAMQAAGFQFSSLPGSQSIRFVWLLIEK